MNNMYSNIHYTSDAENDPTLQDFAPPQMSTTSEGFKLSAQEALYHGPVANLAYDLEYGYDKYIADSKFLSEKEWKESPYYRPNLSFKNGVKENVAKLVADNWDIEAARQEVLNGLPGGFIAGTSKFTGSLLGFALDPANAATAVLAPEIIGAKATPMIARSAQALSLGEKTTKLAAGALEGAAVVAPQEIVNLPSSRLTQENETGLEAMLNIGLGAGLGGVLHLKFGHAVPFFDKDMHDIAKQTAVGQLASGNKVDVGILIKQGAANMYDRLKAATENGNLESFDALSERVKASRDEAVNEYNTNEKALNDHLTDQSNIENMHTEVDYLRDNLEQHIDTVKGKLDGYKQDVNDYNRNKKVTADSKPLTSDNNPFNNNALGALKSLMSDNEKLKTTNKEIKKFTKELGLANDIKADLDKTSARADEALKFDAVADKYKAAESEHLHRQYKKARQKLTDLSMDYQPLPEGERVSSQLEALNQNKKVLQDNINTHDVLLDLLTQEHPHVTKQEVAAASKRQTTAEAASGIDINDLKSYEESLKAIPDESNIDSVISDLESDIQELIQNGDLGDTAVDDLNQLVNELNEEHQARLKAIDLGVNCEGG